MAGNTSPLSGTRAILVLGMHRSGTSALTGVMARLGVHVGAERNVLPPGPDNPKGFWEHAGVFELHEWLLGELKTSWDDIGPMPAGWMSHPSVAKARAKLRTLLESEMAGHALWAVKDPRLSRLLPLWRSLLDDMGVQCLPVLSLRHPLEVAASLAIRDELSQAQSFAIWLRHVVEAAQAMPRAARCVVSYDGLLHDWRAEIDRIAATHHLAWPTPPDRVASDIADYLHADDRHHLAADAPDAASMPAIVGECFDALSQARTSDAAWERFDALARDIDHFAAAYDAAIAALLRERHGISPALLHDLDRSLRDQTRWFNTITAYWLERRESEAAFEALREALDLHVAEAARAHAANASMDEQLQAARTEIARLHADAGGAHADNASLDRQLQAALADARRFDAEARAAHAANASLDEQLQAALQEVRRLADDTQASHAANASLDEQLQAALREVGRLASDGEAAHAANASLDEQLQASFAEVRRLHAASAETLAANTLLGAQLQDSLGELVRLNASEAGTQAEKSSLHDQLQAAASDQQRLSLLVSAVHAELTEARRLGELQEMRSRSLRWLARRLFLRLTRRLD